MKVVVILTLGICSTFALPAKLDHLLASAQRGYNYEPPAKPSGLYELPEPTTTTTTTTTTPPPPPPPPSYLPPQPSEFVPKVVEPEPQPKSAMLMPYDFTYGIDDSESGNKFAHSETSDGEYVTGEYSVLLPDGRLQVVKFKSNPQDGYTADVTYH